MSKSAILAEISSFFALKTHFFVKNGQKLLKIGCKWQFLAKIDPFVQPHSGFIFLIAYDPQVAPAAIHV